MQFTHNNGTSIYINGNYVSIASIASAIQLNLELGAVFNAPPSLAGMGLAYTTGGNPEYISGDPVGPYASAIIPAINALLVPENITLEVVEPTWNIVQPDCECIATITDTTITNNPALAGRGSVRYSVLLDNVWKDLGSVSRGGTRQIDLCCIDPGVYDLRATFTVRQIPNCGGTSPVIFVAQSILPVTITAFMPTISLASMSASYLADCCQAAVGEEVTVTPTYALNRPNNCTLQGFVNPSAFAKLQYDLYDYNGTLISTTQIDIDGATVPNDVLFLFTPALLGDYRVVATLETCCGVVTTEVVIPACNYVIVTTDCHKHTITNLSLGRTLTVNLYEKDGVTVLQDPTYPASVLPGASHVVDVMVDGTYVIKVESAPDVFFYPIADNCSMRECFMKLIRAILCAEKVCGCSSESDARFLLNRMIADGTTYFMLLQNEYGFNNLYTALDPTLQQNLLDMDFILKHINKFCDSECMKQDQNMTGDCASCK